MFNRMQLDGEVVGQNTAAASVSRKVRSFVEQKLKEWLAWRRIDEDMSPFRYRVIVNREGETPQFSCQIRIQSRSYEWQGAGFAPGLHQAVIKALRHMMGMPAQIRPAQLGYIRAGPR